MLRISTDLTLLHDFDETGRHLSSITEQRVRNTDPHLQAFHLLHEQRESFLHSFCLLQAFFEGGQGIGGRAGNNADTVPDARRRANHNLRDTRQRRNGGGGFQLLGDDETSSFP